MSYIENPKTKGSGIVCVIPQDGLCPINCKDCFFQSGRSFLVDKDTGDLQVPNMLDRPLKAHEVVRVNDGNDSDHKRNLVLAATDKWKGRRFFNTSRVSGSFSDLNEPWVLTVNPSEMTDEKFQKALDSELKTLMFVRVRTNLWNAHVVDPAVEYYTSRDIPVVLTFMAYYSETIPHSFREAYEFRKRTLNSYYVIKFDAWKEIMGRYEDNPLVYSCSGPDSFACKRCGTCLREFTNVMDKLAREQG